MLLAVFVATRPAIFFSSFSRRLSIFLSCMAAAGIADAIATSRTSTNERRAIIILIVRGARVSSTL